MEIFVKNANDMFSEVFWRLRGVGVESPSRNGPVVRFNEPVLTQVASPAERVLFHAGRDANPVFHLMEAIWMLAGRRDVAFLQQFNSRMGQYSDDGKVFNAAYGYRWRSEFGRDQLAGVIEKLKSDPTTRQAIVQMWSADDLLKDTKDRPCNMQLIFEILDGRLNMTVINRSNDIWYGYAGANIVHMTFLQEFVARAVGVKLGVYRTFSTNLHLYTELYDAKRYLQSPPQSEDYDLYSRQEVSPYPLMLDDNYVMFLVDCERFCDDPFTGRQYNHPFFNDVAYPVAMVSRARKQGAGTCEAWAGEVCASDWQQACYDWIKRRDAKKQSKAVS